MIRWLLAFSLLAVAASAQSRPNILEATYGDPTDRYAHGILGDAIEYGSLTLTLDMCPECALLTRGEAVITLPENRVFEDLQPQVVDLDHDGINEVIVVETDVRLGAQLAIYGVEGKIAETPFLGQPHRWLAPIGAADFNGDGLMDIAYIEKPHLTKILKIWTYEDGELRQIAEASGLTNHRIGEDFISGGVRTCRGYPEIITASDDWRHVVATRIVEGELSFDTLGPFTGRPAFSDALACR